ncbi:MAG: hypothetical protein V4558_07905 [Gemmatimonadota bacterium]
MDSPGATPLEAFVPVLTWAGSRPSIAEIHTWHEALHDAVASLMPAELVACWLYPARGGVVLVGPPSLTAEVLSPPLAEPLVPQEGLFTLEDQLRAGGYQSAMAIPIRAEVQDVGLLLVGAFADNAYTLYDQRKLHRVAAQLSTCCRRLASYPWVRPRAVGTDHNSTVTGVTEGLLEAMRRARNGSDLVQLASDALALQLPHDRLELIAVAPAPDCWALVGGERGSVASLSIDPDAAEGIDALAHRLGSRAIGRVSDLRDIDSRWPSSYDSRSAERTHSVLAARLEVGDELVGWLWLGSETPDFFREEDEAVARLAAELLAPRVAAWAARAELAGAWS